MLDLKEKWLNKLDIKRYGTSLHFLVKIDISLFKIGFLQLQIYKIARWLNIFSSLFLVVLQYYLWKAICESTIVPDYSFDQIFSYFCLSQIIYIIFPDVSNDISQLVKKGDIIHWLLKPVTIIRQLFFETMGRSVYRLIFIALPILAVILFVFQIIPQVAILNIIKFIIVFILSYLFVFIFEFLVGIFSFFTLSTWGIQSFKYAVITLLSGRFLPISLYPEWIREIFEYLPFKIMYYYPLIVLNNKTSQTILEIIAYQVIWIIILSIITYFFYQKAMKKIMIQGG